MFAASPLSDEDHVVARERPIVLYGRTTEAERRLRRASGKRDGVSASKRGFSRETDGLADENRKTEESLAGATGEINETDDDALRTRRGPKWFWEACLVTATLVLGLESLLARV
ncbi:hypothetical protein VM1G_11451 [Cytospora mali]|uniref:Uncharacterized protein n=1 Tax=Cytospora mali TaxID=578113 RepID=A0A194VQ68_CYTMA|nr:hypothetical protein VM1G_11451 [Valsa mali]